MGSIGEKVAYLKGLAEGLELDTTSKNGKLIAGILDILEAVSESVADLENKTESISGYIEDLDEDLSELEEKAYKFPPMTPKHGYKHPHGGHKHPHANREHECGCGECENSESESDVVELKCPMCGDKIFVEVDMILDNELISCPNCDGPIRIVEKTADSCSGGCCCGDCGGDGEEDIIEAENKDSEGEKDTNKDEE